MYFLKKLKRCLGYICHPKRLLYPNTYCNEVFVEHLKRKGATIGVNTRFINPSESYVDPGRLDYITIGDNCCLSYASLIAHDYSWYVLGDAFGDLLPDPGGRIVIGNNVFIGYRACILKNTTIGDNVIIGAGAVVKGNIPSNTVWAGIPARKICTLEELYEKKNKNKFNDAVYRRDFIREKYSRDPMIEEMGFFAMLFLQRSEENYKKFIKPLEFNGIKGTENIRNIFFSRKPLFSSFEDFLSYKAKEIV